MTGKGKFLYCPKCGDGFRSPVRHSKHIAKCPGKVCRVCGKVGHIACGISVTNAEDFFKKLKEENKTIQVVIL